MAPKKHVHKYHRIALGFGKVWSCALPECNHFMPNNMTGRVIGKMSICWKCEEKFILNENNMENDQPICSDCNPTVADMAALLQKFGVK